MSLQFAFDSFLGSRLDDFSSRFDDLWFCSFAKFYTNHELNGKLEFDKNFGLSMLYISVWKNL